MWINHVFTLTAYAARWARLSGPRSHNYAEGMAWTLYWVQGPCPAPGGPISIAFYRDWCPLDYVSPQNTMRKVSPSLRLQPTSPFAETVWKRNQETRLHPMPLLTSSDVALRPFPHLADLDFKGRFPLSVQFSSVAQSCPTLCNPMNHSTPGLPVHHQLPELTQTHAHRVGDAIHPSHPLSSPSPPAPNLSQYQGLFQRVNSSHEVAKVLEFQLQHQSFQRTPRTDLLQGGLVGLPCSPRDSLVPSNSLCSFFLISIFFYLSVPSLSCGPGIFSLRSCMQDLLAEWLANS